MPELSAAVAEAWQPWVAAAIAPALVWVLWRIQVLAVELLRFRIVKLVGHAGWLYSTVMAFGVFLHELSHASVLLLSGHGIKEFRSGVESGHVLPARTRRGFVGFLSFLVAALAPMLIPPALVLAALVLLVDRGLIPWDAPADAWTAALDALRRLATEFPLRLGHDVANLDLAKWPQLLVFVLMLVGMPASRPSHIKGSRFHGTESEGDVAVLRRRIREQPWVFVLFLALLYGAYFALRPFIPAAYWYPFEAFWAIALTGILLALGGSLWWSLAALNARTKRWAAWLPFAAFIGVEFAARHPALAWPPVLANAVALAAWAALSLTLWTLLPRRRRI